MKLAESHAKRAIELANASGGFASKRMLESQIALADVWADLGRWDEVVELLGRIQPMVVQTFGAESTLGVIASAAYGDALQVVGRHQEAEPILRETWELARKVLPPGAAQIKPLNALNASLRAQGKEDIELRRMEFEGLRDSIGPRDALTMVALTNYAIALGSAGRNQEGVEAIKVVLEALQNRLPDDHAVFGELHGIYATLLHRVGKQEESIAAQQRGVEILSDAKGERDPATQRARRGLLRALARADKFEAAEAALIENVRRRVDAGDEATMPDLLQLWAELAFVGAEAGLDRPRIDAWIAKAQPQGARPISAEDGVSLLVGSTVAWCDLHAGRIDAARATMDEVMNAAKNSPASMRGLVGWLESSAARFKKRLEPAAPPSDGG